MVLHKSDLWSILGIKNNIYTQDIIKIDYTKNKDYIYSIILSVILIIIVIVFGNIVVVNVNISTGNLCENKNSQVSYIKNIFSSTVNISLIKDNIDMLENHTNFLWNIANNTHNGWPNPRELSDSEKADLQYRTQLSCRRNICIGPNIIFNCRTINYPCPDISAQQTLHDIELWSVQRPDEFNATVIIPDVNGRLVNILETFITRVTILNSIYIIYTIICIFTVSAYNITGKSIRAKMTNIGVTKYQWIIITIMSWYSYEYLKYLFNTVEFKLYVKSINTNPCLLDKEYLRDMYNTASDTCNDVNTLKNRWSIIQRDYQNYYYIDKSYVNLGERQVFPYMENTELNITCDSSSLVEMGYDLVLDSKLDTKEWIKRFGGFLSIFLQTFLSMLIIHIFQYRYPLCLSTGRVIIPSNTILSPLIKDKIKKHAKLGSIIPIILYSIIIVFIFSTSV